MIDNFHWLGHDAFKIKGSIVGAAEDPRRFSDALKGKIRVVILPQE